MNEDKKPKNNHSKRRSFSNKELQKMSKSKNLAGIDRNHFKRKPYSEGGFIIL